MRQGYNTIFSSSAEIPTYYIKPHGSNSISGPILSGNIVSVLLLWINSDRSSTNPPISYRNQKWQLGMNVHDFQDQENQLVYKNSSLVDKIVLKFHFNDLAAMNSNSLAANYISE